MHGGIAAVLLATHLTAATPPPQAACARAAAAAERRWALPAGLLLAIGQVESGRRDPVTGQFQPWPWSVDVGGQDYVFASAAEAVTVTGYLQAHGIGSIDVGCFQVNLHYHGAAFASVARGYDPDANADYAARFLRRLFARSGSWAAAIGNYHSADPALGQDYRARVLRVWREPGSAVAAGGGDPHVILAAGMATPIPVYTPLTLPPAWRAGLGVASHSQR